MMHQARKKQLKPLGGLHDDLRHARVSRTGDVHIEEGDQHAWAVSYSDLLMVLLSFFVLFFAFADEKASNGVISEIALTFGEKVGTPAKTTTAAGPKGPEASSDEIRQSPENLQPTLNEDVLRALAAVSPNVDSQSKTDAIWLRLPPDIYPSRAYDLTATSKTYLDEIFAALIPFKDKISLTFVGHSDSRPLTKKRGILKSNFVLSSLRAAGALDYALTKGFDSVHLFTQGAASNLEDSRTLSLKITALAEGQK